MGFWFARLVLRWYGDVLRRDRRYAGSGGGRWYRSWILVSLSVVGVNDLGVKCISRIIGNYE